MKPINARAIEGTPTGSLIKPEAKYGSYLCLVASCVHRLENCLSRCTALTNDPTITASVVARVNDA